jgi:hypothetical protein
VSSYLNLSEYKQFYTNAANNHAFPRVMQAFLSLVCALNARFSAVIIKFLNAFLARFENL